MAIPKFSKIIDDVYAVDDSDNPVMLSLISASGPADSIVKLDGAVIPPQQTNLFTMKIGKNRDLRGKNLSIRTLVATGVIPEPVDTEEFTTFIKFRLDGGVNPTDYEKDGKVPKTIIVDTYFTRIEFI
jgi:hypothetical protein